MYHVAISNADFSKTSGCQILQENNRLLIINDLIPIFVALKGVLDFFQSCKVQEIHDFSWLQ